MARKDPRAGGGRTDNYIKSRRPAFDATQIKMDEHTAIIRNIVYARDPKIFDTKSGHVN